jgi:hypothetical protein
MLKKIKSLNLFFLLFVKNIFGQNTTINNYPKQTIFFSVVHPLVTHYGNKEGSVFNFDDTYTIGFPIGVNTIKSDRFGYSFEITPFIKSEKGVTKMSNLMFHPGLIFRFPKAFSINTRMAFETAGRFGTTFVFSKVVAKTDKTNYFIAIPIPLRFANDRPTSVGLGLQLGITIL